MKLLSIRICLFVPPPTSITQPVGSGHCSQRTPDDGDRDETPKTFVPPLLSPGLK